MRLVFAGTPEVAVPALHALLASRHEVVAVLTRPDARTGRGRRTAPSPVKAAAAEAGIDVLTPTRLRDDGVAQALADLRPDCCPVVAYGNLVPPGLLELPRLGWVNLHFSLLPAWRGAAPVQRAVMAGDDESGACVFQLEPGLDTGPVLGRLREPIAPTDTAGDLLGRLAERGAHLLVDVLDQLEAGTATAEPQPAEGVSLAPKIEVDDARVDWAQPAAAVDRLVRGCTPAPGAWTTFRGERVRLDPVRIVAEAREPSDGGLPDGALSDAPVGTLDVTSTRVRVRAGAGAVELGVVRAAGRRPMSAADWARGARPEPGERFE